MVFCVYSGTNDRSLLSVGLQNVLVIMLKLYACGLVHLPIGRYCESAYWIVEFPPRTRLVSCADGLIRTAVLAEPGLRYGGGKRSMDGDVYA